MHINEDMGIQSCHICQIYDKKMHFCYKVPTLSSIIFKNIHAGHGLVKKKAFDT
jgi:hypothetical protein